MDGLTEKDLKIRRANSADFERLVQMDPTAVPESRHTTFIERSIRGNNCFVAILDNQVVGYAVLEYSFFENGFVSLLVVAPKFRRQGIGECLMKDLEKRCVTEKFFTSTNESNLPMRELLGKLGFSPSGVIENLDEGDPEMVYFKRIAPE